MPDIVLDTNVVLRHLLQDHVTQSPAASSLLRRIERGEIEATLTAVAVAEAVWVLQGRNYRLSRNDIRDALLQVVQMPHLHVTDRGVLEHALVLYGRFNIDFADCFHAAVVRALGSAVYSFDHDFDGLPGITRIEPPATA